MALRIYLGNLPKAVSRDYEANPPYNAKVIVSGTRVATGDDFNNEFFMNQEKNNLRITALEMLTKAIESDQPILKNEVISNNFICGATFKVRGEEILADFNITTEKYEHLKDQKKVQAEFNIYFFGYVKRKQP